jgi:hypothetical protein
MFHFDDDSMMVNCRSCEAEYTDVTGNPSAMYWQNEEGKVTCVSCPHGWVAKTEPWPEGNAVHSITEIAAGPADAGSKYTSFCQQLCFAGKYTYGVSTINGARSCASCPEGQFSGRVTGLCEKDDFTTDAVSLFEHQRHGKTNVCMENLPPPLSSSERGQWATQICTYCPTGYHSVDKDGVTSTATDTPYPSEQPPYDVAYKAKEYCVKCPLGKYNEELGRAGEVQCKVCPAGRYNDAIGEDVECKKCPAGTYLSISANTDTAISHERKTQCVVCPAGKFNERKEATDQAQCEDCPAGFFIDDGRGGEPHGKEHTDDSLTTTHAAFHDELKDCLICPAGYYTSETGGDMLGCKACPMGRFLTQTALDTFARDPAPPHAKRYHARKEDVNSGLYGFAPDMLKDCEIW